MESNYYKRASGIKKEFFYIELLYMSYITAYRLKMFKTHFSVFKLLELRVRNFVLHFVQAFKVAVKSVFFQIL